MADTLTLKAYLETKSETNLKSLLLRVEGNAARLNGSKRILVDRLLQSANHFDSERMRQAFPGYERARSNWRRAAAAARSPLAQAVAVSSRRPPLFRLADAGRLALPQQAINVNLGRSAAASPVRNLSHFTATPHLRSAAPRSLQGSLQEAVEASRSAQVRPALPGTPPVRHRSKSSSSPTSLSNLRDKYTCKVCLAAEVEVAIKPCGHLCLCSPCSAALRRHHVEARIGDIFLGDALPPTPCPICRGPIRGVLRVYC